MTHDDNGREGKDEDRQKNIMQSIVTNKRNKKVFSDILSGNNKIAEGIFRKMLRNGHFSKIRSRSQKEIGMWEDDLCQIVCMSILKKDFLGQLGKIRSAPAYIHGIIWKRCLSENKRLEKSVSIDLT